MTIRRITTIRHAESVYNGQKRYAGTIDIPLSDRGRADAKNAASQLIGLGIEEVVSSALQRTIQTASIIATRLNVPHTGRHELCDERNFGALQGLTEDELGPHRNHLRYIRVGGDFHSVNPPDGETFPQLRARAYRFDRFLKARYNEIHVLVVSHGVFLQQLHGVFLGLDWIDALERHVSQLEFRSFEFAGDRLVRSTGLCLAAQGNGW